MLIEYDALKELDNVHRLIAWSRIETLLSDIHTKPKGEKAWPPFNDVQSTIISKLVRVE